MTATDLIVVGGGGHAREMLWLSTQATQRYRIVGYLDDAGSAPRDLDGATHLGPVARCTDFVSAHFVVAVGSPRVRHELVRRLRDGGAHKFAQLIHRDATLSNRVMLGDGAQICAGARITTNVEIGEHSIVNQNCTLAHDCILGAFVTLAPLVGVSGNVQLRNGAEIGTGAVLHQGITVGAGAMVGMGAVVVDDVAAGDLVIGNPARRLRALGPFGA